MSPDEAEIRQLIATWMAATKAGDINTVLSLMTEDVVFLLPGQQSILGKSAFAESARAMSGQDRPHFEGTSEIQEIKVLGDWAFIWTKLRVIVTPGRGAQPVTRAGFTLSILKKENGKWLLTRDANMLSPVAAEMSSSTD